MKIVSISDYLLQMDYQNIYNKIISRALLENREKYKGVYYEAHHIIPKCLGGTGKSSQWRTHNNIVLLTAKEHYLCHRLLAEIHNIGSLWLALFRMSSINCRQKRVLVSAKTYLLIKEKMIEEKKKFKHTDEAKELIKQSSLGRPSYWRGKTRDAKFKLQAYERMKGNQFNKGVPKSEETKQRLREKNKGQKRSEETKQKMRKPKAGLIEKGKPWTAARRQAQIDKKNKNADSFN